ncbi:MAG: AAA family ATPase [Alphaproteobacteria bacterium]|nr:AAA family ATPase [Alphaproteobacteria bacterium]
MTDKPERHGQAWSAEEERKLYDAFADGVTIKECAGNHQRTAGGIRSCLKRLGLIDEDGNVIMPRPEYVPSPAALKRQAKTEAKAKKAQRRRVARPQDKPGFSPELNERFREALHFMEKTENSLFVTGKAGTGKSTLLSYFCHTTNKELVVLAPTGVAALNVGGQTIHSFFNFYVDVTPEKIRRKKTKPKNAKLYKKLKTILIDEVSMVRADLLDCVDAFLRLHGPDAAKPFGGVQMIFVGDLYQLPPVVTSQERVLFATHYKTPYFFSAHALAGAGLDIVELDKVYRQKDQDFIDLLNKIRNNSVDGNDIARLNSRLSQKETPPNGGFHITLTATNATADAINAMHLAALKESLRCSVARVEGNFGKEYFPTAVDLNYKIGAQIMLLNNDSDRRWVNGSIGAIAGAHEDEEGQEYLTVRLQGEKRDVEVYPHTWEVFRFALDGESIVSESAGTFTQYPFRLAWAITIHKSQGKTFARVVIDIGRGAFAAGQTYVALSRCTSFAGVTLRTPIRPQDIRTDTRIIEFLTGAHDNIMEPEMPMGEKIALIQHAIEEKAALDITYLKADDTKTTRKVIPLKVGPAIYKGVEYEGMKAICVPHEEERMFRVDRILKIGKAKE